MGYLDEYSIQTKRLIDVAVQSEFDYMPEVAGTYPTQTAKGREEIHDLMLMLTMRVLRGKANPTTVRKVIVKKMQQLYPDAITTAIQSPQGVTHD